MRKRTAKSAGTRREVSKHAGNALPGPASAEDASPRGKIRLTMYLDTAVVEYFRSRSGGRGYQTLINEALKTSIEQEHLEDVLRRVIREEARPYQATKAKA